LHVFWQNNLVAHFLPINTKFFQVSSLNKAVSEPLWTPNFVICYTRLPWNSTFFNTNNSNMYSGAIYCCHIHSYVLKHITMEQQLLTAPQLHSNNGNAVRALKWLTGTVISGVRPYKCNLCEKSFTQRCSLESHCLKVHGVQHQYAYKERRTKVRHF
jgi:hypothetical protein